MFARPACNPVESLQKQLPRANVRSLCFRASLSRGLLGATVTVIHSSGIQQVSLRTNACAWRMPATIPASAGMPLGGFVTCAFSHASIRIHMRETLRVPSVPWPSSDPVRRGAFEKAALLTVLSICSLESRMIIEGLMSRRPLPCNVQVRFPSCSCSASSARFTGFWQRLPQKQRNHNLHRAKAH